ncbi:MAG TPA: hypothetical protein VKR32_10905 [Puia sp.]|nr:hypothetical protein [Puia sp.]
MSKQILTALCILFSALVHGQDTSFIALPVEPTDSIPVDKLSIGIGGGFEYGGIGANVTYYPTRGLGLFFGAGYPLTGFGYNAGVKLRIVSDQTITEFMPYLIAMYGYNATVIYPEFTQKNKVFYGATVGAGIDFRPGNSKFGYLSASIYVPIRSSGVKDYIAEQNQVSGLTYSTGRIFALSASIGYKIIIKNHKITPVPPPTE